MLIKDSYTIEALTPYLPDRAHPEPAVPTDIDLNSLIELAASCDVATAEAITTSMKIGVEHSADTDPDIACALADTIVAIGRRREDGSMVGLGMLAHGDILTHTGQYSQAWDMLEEAGRIYLDAGDRIGWARTRVNRLYVSAELSEGSDYIAVAFEDAVGAEQILLDAGRYDRLMRLYHAWGFASLLMGRYEQAIVYYQKALAAAEQQADGQNTPILMASLHSDIGAACTAIGELQTAMTHLTAAQHIFLDASHHIGAAVTGREMALTETIRGQYRPAMHLLLNSVLPHLDGQRADGARLILIECMIALNRDREALEIARTLVSTSAGDPDRRHLAAMAALLLAAVEARLGEFAAAQVSLDLAEAYFSTYPAMVAQVRLRRAQVALRQGDIAAAHATAEAAADAFRRWQQPANWIDALLVCAEAALLTGNANDAEHYGIMALRNARRAGLDPASARAFDMLAQVYEWQGKRHSMVRACRAALGVLERMQRNLSPSLRTNFLEDKLRPFHRLMAVHLENGQSAEAFETLERLKAQVFAEYLLQRELPNWKENDQTGPLLEKLTRLRDKHRWLTRLQSMPPAEETAANGWYREIGSYTDLLAATATCEMEIRRLSEQLALHTEPVAHASAVAAQLPNIQRCLDNRTLLITYYIGHDQAWCIGITTDRAICHVLPVTADALQQLIADKWQSNLEFALSVGPDDPRAAIFTEKARRIGEKLYQALLEPLAAELERASRLMVVPYGILHQLPFNLLRRGEAYLIETHELVILPAASLLLRPAVRRAPGGLVLANSWDGRLSLSAAEGHAVFQAIGGSLYLEAEANRAALDSPPRQVLHVSTHGEHRIDQPDFSYVELAGGPVYTDDLLQCDLSYELVVLSACEVGRSKITAGEEMIGLGRGFLYAGAGALITSLWRVNEAHTFHLMQVLYRALRRGESKARALQTAQRALLAQDPSLHPAFWAAFQLICNPDPLSNA